MDIKAAEISDILKKQIADFSELADVAEVGQVLSVGDGVARDQAFEGASIWLRTV